MPRYFFHVVEAKSLRTTVRDGEGTVLSDKAAAQKEAVGLARDIATHGVHGSGEWKVVVIDQDGHTILTVPLSEVRARRTRPWHKLRGLISNLVFRQPRAFALNSSTPSHAMRSSNGRSCWRHSQRYARDAPHTVLPVTNRCSH